MRRLSSRLLAPAVVVAVVCGVLSVPTQPAVAAVNSPSAGGVTVTPGRLDYELKEMSGPDAVQSRTVTITNNYDIPLRVSAQLKGIDEAANIIVPAGDVDKDVAASIALSETDIAIKAHSSQALTVQVSNLPTLEPGGHYVTLILTPLPEAAPGTAPAVQSSIRSSVSLSLFIVKQISGVQALLKVDTVSFNHWLFGVPGTATLQVSNRGSVHGVPRAVVLVTSDDGRREFARGIANQQSRTLLPNRQASYDVPLTRAEQAPMWLPQRLQLQVNYRFDGDNDSRSLTRSVWYVPPVYLLALPVLTVVGWYIGRTLRSRQRAIAMKLQKTPRPVVVVIAPEQTAAPARATSMVPKKQPTQRAIVIADNNDQSASIAVAIGEKQKQEQNQEPEQKSEPKQKSKAATTKKPKKVIKTTKNATKLKKPLKNKKPDVNKNTKTTTKASAK